MDNSIRSWLIVGAVFALAIIKTHARHRTYATAKEAYRDALRQGPRLTAAGRRLNAGAKTARECQ